MRRIGGVGKGRKQKREGREEIDRGRGGEREGRGDQKRGGWSGGENIERREGRTEQK